MKSSSAQVIIKLFVIQQLNILNMPLPFLLINLLLNSDIWFLILSIHKLNKLLALCNQKLITWSRRYRLWWQWWMHHIKLTLIWHLSCTVESQAIHLLETCYLSIWWYTIKWKCKDVKYLDINQIISWFQNNYHSLSSAAIIAFYISGQQIFSMILK